MSNRFAAAATAWILIPALSLCATVPAAINYQGRLVDSQGDPISGNVTVSVDVYTNDTTGVSSYSEAVGQVPVQNGLYSFSFGADLPALLAVLRTGEAWLEVTIDGDPMLPRQRLVAVPYAVVAENVRVDKMKLGHWSTGGPAANGAVPTYVAGTRLGALASPFDGDLTALVIQKAGSITGGSLQAEVFVNEVATGFSVTADNANPFVAVSQPPGTVSVSAGDAVSISITATNFAPVGEGSIHVMVYGEFEAGE
jgi:hypothetical protein